MSAGFNRESFLGIWVADEDEELGRCVPSGAAQLDGPTLIRLAHEVELLLKLGSKFVRCFTSILPHLSTGTVIVSFPRYSVVAVPRCIWLSSWQSCADLGDQALLSVAGSRR